ncbi:unnamed protein product [Rodentolepis nana]|uniref:YqaJ domain-containing protein n=1 Tax=Rodentolepis nana TaxID=102285 RepID=A0A0R3TC56_RODNA|nr:unnamed protein product [Rodentolepis nana]
MIRCAKKTIPRGKTKHSRVFWSKHLEELKGKRDGLRNTVNQTGGTEDVKAWRRQSAVLRQAILQAKRTSFDNIDSNLEYDFEMGVTGLHAEDVGPGILPKCCGFEKSEFAKQNDRIKLGQMCSIKN